MKRSYKDGLAFPEFEDVLNSQVILYSYSSSFLDTTKKGKKRVTYEKKNNTFSRVNFQGPNTIWILIAISLCWIPRSSHPDWFFKLTCSLRIWRNLQENFCAGVSFRLKACKFTKKRLPQRCFLMSFAKKIVKNKFLTGHLGAASSESISAEILINNTPVQQSFQKWFYLFSYVQL